MSTREATTTPQLIDEKVAHLEECIRQLKTQRNELAPISRLPPEILARIFSFALAGRTRTSPIVEHYYFSHVSGWWRSIALSTPTLWQVLPHNVQWATAMLERSKGADLVVESFVDSNYTSSCTSFLKEVLTKHTSRIRELDLTGLKIPTLFENLRQSSLQLRSLKLAGPAIPDAIFPTGVMETTDLRILSVKGYGGPWWSLSLPALTNLKLQDIRNRPPLIEFLEMLRGVPALEALDMEDSLPLANDQAGLTGPIELPLSFLRLLSSTDYKEVTNILSVIIVPTVPTLKLGAIYQRSVTAQDVKLILDGLASSLTTFFCPHTDLSYRNLHVFSRESDLLLSAWKDDGDTSATPDLELILSLEDKSFQDMLRPLFRSVPVFNMTTLTLDTSCGRMLLKDVFGRLSHLRNIKVVGDSACEFLHALIRRFKLYETKRSSYYSVFFPAIRSLWIEATSFKESGRCAVEYLEDCLIERYERKAGLLKLRLTDCRELRYDDVQSLRHIVVDVEWDGCERDDSTSDGSDESVYIDLDYYSDGYS